jgi:serine/threonine protein kinase
MPFQMDQLRRAVVEIWQIFTPEAWQEIANHSAGDLEPILTHLRSKARFRYRGQGIPFLTADLEKSLTDGVPTSMVVLIGQVPWLLVQKLGKGGFGEVWMSCPCQPNATQAQLGALKRVRPDLSTEKRDRAVVHAGHEIRIVRRIARSKHLAALIDAEEATGTFVTRLVEGPNLYEKTQGLGRLSLFETLRIGVHVCQALSYLHAENHIHRDVKPANIIDEANQCAVLVDFGLAEMPKIASREFAGTIYFIAPEVYTDGQPVDFRADIFSLGATLYYLLTGQPPHFHKCFKLHAGRMSRSVLDVERFLLYRSDVDCDISDVRTDLPEAFCRILNAALSTSPDSRQDSIAALEKALTRVQEKIRRAEKVQKELEQFSERLLDSFREIQEDPDYEDVPWKQAKNMLEDFRTLLPDFRLLQSLALDPDFWQDFSTIHHLVPKTVKLIRRFDAALLQLEDFLRSHPVSQETLQVRLLENLLSQTLESHSWRSALAAMGVGK